VKTICKRGKRKKNEENFAEFLLAFAPVPPWLNNSMEPWSLFSSKGSREKFILKELC
jgi:hypothetical protein